MGIIDRKSDDDEQLPGSGMRVDLDVRVCPRCRREAMPWESQCPECGVATVAPVDVPATEVVLPPGLRDLDEGDDTDPLDEDAGDRR